jgi:nucleoporin GLE1
MAGIATLYFAILQTPLGSLMRYIPSPPSPDELLVLIIPPLRLPAAWTWISFALRDSMPSLPPIATILASWIEVCGFAVGRTFGLTQLTKVYDAIKKEGLGEGTIKGDSEAARQRLAMLLDGPWQDHEPQGRHWE